MIMKWRTSQCTLKQRLPRRAAVRVLAIADTDSYLEVERGNAGRAAQLMGDPHSCSSRTR